MMQQMGGGTPQEEGEEGQEGQEGRPRHPEGPGPDQQGRLRPADAGGDGGPAPRSAQGLRRAPRPGLTGCTCPERVRATIMGGRPSAGIAPLHRWWVPIEHPGPAPRSRVPPPNVEGRPRPWPFDSVSCGWARRSSPPIASSPPTPARPATAVSSRSSGPTTPAVSRPPITVDNEKAVELAAEGRPALRAGPEAPEDLRCLGRVPGIEGHQVSDVADDTIEGADESAPSGGDASPTHAVPCSSTSPGPWSRRRTRCGSRSSTATAGRSST